MLKDAFEIGNVPRDMASSDTWEDAVCSNKDVVEINDGEKASDE